MNGRFSPFKGADQLVSDGTNDTLNLAVGQQESTRVSDSVLRRNEGKESWEEEECEHMYGFLPCSQSVLGHLFLIVVYEYLLFHGESYLLYGGGRIFEILGTGFFGASAFPVIAQLPEPLILLVTGLFSSDEGAQENVLTGVGMVAGSTIFSLTVLWGTCLFLGRQLFAIKANSSPSTSTSTDVQHKETSSLSTGLLPSYNSNANPIPAETQEKKPPSLLTGYGVGSDPETSSAARIMLYSLIPFIIILIPKIFGVSYASSAYNVDILITLIALVICLLAYFKYQFSHSSIQKRRLEYLEFEHQTHLLAVIHHLQDYIPGQVLLDDHGAPNDKAILRLFQTIDIDGDNKLSSAELTELFNRIRLTKSAANRESALEKIMKDLDHNEDNTITLDEFLATFKKWLHEIMCVGAEPIRHTHHLQKPVEHFDEAVTLVLEEQEVKKLKKEILGQIRNSPIWNLCTPDGRPDEYAIRKLFEDLDVDKNQRISQDELKALIRDENFGKTNIGKDQAAEVLFNDLDTDGDNEINQEEFIKGLRRWIKSDGTDENYKVDKSAWAWTKAIMLLVLGIAMLAVLAEPLIHSVQKFSTAANIPSFYVAFVLVPLATSARTAISAIRATKQQIPKTTSLTFSEIYDGVFMNNVLGFSVLLSIVYFRGLTWHFSAEVMIVVIVCAVMGLIATFRAKFPVWIMLVAYLFYPLSLILLYVVDDYFSLP